MTVSDTKTDTFGLMKTDIYCVCVKDERLPSTFTEAEN